MLYPSICFICRGDHTYLKCPDFPRPPEPPSLSRPEEKPKRFSLARTQFEELYGEDGLQVLDWLLGDPELTSEQQALAVDLIEGTKTIKSLTAVEREILDSLATVKLETPDALATKKAVLAIEKATGQKQSTEPPRSPPYISTWQEMQDHHPDFEGDYR